MGVDSSWHLSLPTVGRLSRWPQDFVGSVTVGYRCGQTGASLGDQKAAFNSLLWPWTDSKGPQDHDAGVCAGLGKPNAGQILLVSILRQVSSVSLWTSLNIRGALHTGETDLF